MRRYGFLLAGAWIAIAPACSWFQSEEPIPQNVVTVPSEYRVGPNDVLSVIVWKQPDISLGQIPVRPDGRISLPLVGEIDVTGLTALQIKEVLTERLKEYVTDPNVTVIVLQVNYPVAFIIGEVNRPGPVSIRQDTTMLQLISMAGGFTSFADRDSVQVIRHDGGKAYRLKFNYSAVVKGKNLEQNVFVKPGDVIVVED